MRNTQTNPKEEGTGRLAAIPGKSMKICKTFGLKGISNEPIMHKWI